jgi:hypothetical protein
LSHLLRELTLAPTALRTRVLCPSSYDLRGSIVRIVVHEDGVVKDTDLTEFDASVDGTDDFVVKAPIEPGEYGGATAFA